MTDDQYANEKLRTKACLDYWVRMLGLGNWQIDIDYHRDFNEAEPTTRADVSPAWEYLHAKMNIYCRNTAEDNIRELNSTMIHELVHCLNDCAVPPPDQDDNLREMGEFSTSSITNAILYVYGLAKEEDKFQWTEKNS